MFGVGIDKLGDLINVASDLEIVQKAGSWYSYGETRLGQGKEKAAEFLTENPELIREIRERVTMEVRGGDYPLPRASKLTTLVLLSGVSDVPRLKQLQAVAVETKQNLDQIREESPKALQEMIWSGSDSIEPLY
jgi:hypothetical protein